MYSKQSDLWRTKIDIVSHILHGSGTAEFLQYHSELMYSYIRHGFHKPGYLFPKSTAIKSKKRWELGGGGGKKGLLYA